MLIDFLVGMGLYLGYIVAGGLPLVLIKLRFRLPFELTRKLYHLLVTLSIFPLVHAFRTWYLAVLAAALITLLVYPLLKLVERSSFYQRIAVERSGGEFKNSLIVVQLSLSLVIILFWGVLGEQGRYIAVAAVMAWGFGDAAAALIGKKFGRRKIWHPQIKGTKTMEGTHAMYVTAVIAVFTTLLFYAGLPWLSSLAVALLVAPVCALVELFSSGVMDTLTVPVSTGLAILSALSLFASLGF